MELSRFAQNAHFAQSGRWCGFTNGRYALRPGGLSQGRIGCQRLCAVSQQAIVRGQLLSRAVSAWYELFLLNGDDLGWRPQ